MGCISLESVNIPKSVGVIEKDAFYGCTNLTEIMVDKPNYSISRAHWGAVNAKIKWQEPK